MPPTGRGGLVETARSHPTITARASPHALKDDVLLADTLDGEPLDSDHGAPVRLVSPSHYGFISTKHLSPHRDAHVRTSGASTLDR